MTADTETPMTAEDRARWLPNDYETRAAARLAEERAAMLDRYPVADELDAWETARAEAAAATQAQAAAHTALRAALLAATGYAPGDRVTAAKPWGDRKPRLCVIVDAELTTWAGFSVDVVVHQLTKKGDRSQGVKPWRVSPEACTPATP